MYRESDESFAATIERLERELAEMRGLSGSPRRRVGVLAFVTALSLVTAVLFGAACASSYARAEALQRHLALAARLLDQNRQDLRTYEHLVSARERAFMRCGTDAWDEPATKRSSTDD